MPPSPSDEGSSLIRNLSIFTASVVSLSGAFQAWSSVRITQSLEEAKRTQAFSRQILDQMDNLTGDNETKGKVALVGLYIIATNEKDKLNIANLALQSGKNSLRDAAAFLLGQECKENPQLSTCKTALELLARAEEVSVQSQIRKGGTANVAVQPSPVAMALEEITTAKLAESELQGWIYIGKADPSGGLRDDRTINARRKPGPGADVTTITSVYLRDKGSIRSGSSLGIIPRGQILRIHGLQSTPLPGGNEAVWAKVKTQTSAVQKVP